MGNSAITLSDHKKIFVGYFQSWSEPWMSDVKKLQLANVASYVNIVVISFMRPDATYEKGSYKLGKKDDLTGLEFSVDGEVIKNAIALLKQKNPQTKVLLSVGGSGYRERNRYEALLNDNQHIQAIVDVVEDFGFDGVDICFEPYDYAQCSADASGIIHCNTDELYSGVVKKVRERLQRPHLLTIAAWSVGAYGEGQWTKSQPSGLPLTGLLINLLRKQADDIDLLNIMSYNASAKYDPQEALAAYRHYFPKGKIVMGIQVPPDDWPLDEAQRYVYTIAKVGELAQVVLDKNADGIMLWSLQKSLDVKEDQNNPNPEMIAKEVCKIFSLGNCQQPLFSN